MKKILILAFILFTARAYSQGVNLGVTAGFNLSTLPGSFPFSGNPLPGFQLGGLVDVGSKNFSFQPGVMYTSVGGEAPGNDQRTVLSYLQIPVNFLYKNQMGNGTFFIGGGPYVGFGMAGSFRYTNHGSFGSSNSYQKLLFGSFEDLHNPDIGANAQIGFRFKSGYAISAGYGLGFVDVYNDGPDNKNHVASISVTYFFKP